MMADGKAGSRKNMAMMYEGKNVEGIMKKVACSIPVLHVKNGYALWGAFFRKHGPPFSVFIIARKAWRVPSPPPLPKFVWPNLGIPLLSIFYYNKKSVKLNFSTRQVYTNFFLVFSAT